MEYDLIMNFATIVIIKISIIIIIAVITVITF